MKYGFGGALAALGVLVVGSAAGTLPAQALTMKECSAKYQEAKKAGTLKDTKWNDFRKAECGSATDDKAEDTKTKKDAAAKPETKAAESKAKPAASGDAVFPSKIAEKYAKESAGKARMHTCRDQYQENKAKNANGGLHWIQKGGGYYSECNKRLKG